MLSTSVFSKQEVDRKYGMLILGVDKKSPQHDKNTSNKVTEGDKTVFVCWKLKGKLIFKFF